MASSYRDPTFEAAHRNLEWQKRQAARQIDPRHALIRKRRRLRRLVRLVLSGKFKGDGYGYRR